MPRLYPAKIIIKALQRVGFTLVSQKGSHIKLTKTQEEKTYTVIVPNYKEVPIGTFQSILKQSGMNKQEFDKIVK